MSLLQHRDQPQRGGACSSAQLTFITFSCRTGCPSIADFWNHAAGDGHSLHEDVQRCLLDSSHSTVDYLCGVIKALRMREVRRLNGCVCIHRIRCSIGCEPRDSLLPRCIMHGAMKDDHVRHHRSLSQSKTPH